MRSVNRVLGFLVVLVLIAVRAKAFVLGANTVSNRLASSAHGDRESSTIMKDSNDPSNESTEKIESKTWNPLRLAVLKLGMTEPALTSPWNYQKKQGTFTCAYCGQELFDSNGKYDSGSGWPSFWRTKSDGFVALKREWDGRVECQCSTCGGHLGHVFMDGPSKTSLPEDLVQTIPEGDLKSPTNPSRLPRYCINGASLRFDEKKDS